jgi:hypothetical protein
MLRYNKSNVDNISVLEVRENMRKTHSRMQSLIKLSPTLLRMDSHKVSLSNNLATNASKIKNANLLVNDKPEIMSENIFVSQVKFSLIIFRNM